MGLTFGEVNIAATGLFAASIEGGTLKDLARGLKPDVPWVVIEGYAPFENLDWTETPIPLTVPSSAPLSMMRVRKVSFDLLMDTAEFRRHLVDLDTGGGGLRFWQLRRIPTSRNWTLQQLESDARRAVYEDLGVVLSFDLPSRYGYGVIAALDRSS